MSINSITLIGRVGSDPELNYYDSGRVRCKLTLAVNRRSRSDEPDWFNLELWGKTAEIAKNYVQKGKQIGVKGSLKFNTWVDNKGANRSSPVIVVDQLELLGSKRDTDNSASDFDGSDNF